MIHTTTPQPITTREELAASFETIIRLDAALNAARDDVVAFKQEPKPQQPTQVETLDEWFAYQDALKAYQARKEQVDAAFKAADEEYKQLSRRLMATLPQRVWFRCGDQGIGIAHTNWGGNSVYVVVEPWQEQMPTLDHNYRGD